VLSKMFLLAGYAGYE